MILARTRNKSLEYLNTSYVKVQLVFWTILPMLSVYLNTSYVKVQFNFFSIFNNVVII